MRYAILSDIHGNLEALRSVVNACQDAGVRKYFCLGDIVGYGANPNQCVELIKDLKAVTVAGNHDWAVSQKIDFDHFSPDAKAAVIWTQKKIYQEHLAFLSELPLTYQTDEMALTHSTLNRPEDFLYLTDTGHSLDTFYLMKTNLCLTGHTHVPQVFMKKGDNISFSAAQSIELMEKNRYIINVGSVGQPRDGNPRASFAIFDPDLKRIEIKRVAYDIQAAQLKILESGLPDFLARRLSIGQ